MSSSHLRELVMYQRTREGGFYKVRRAASTFSVPPPYREMSAGPKSLYCFRVFSPEGPFTLVWGVVMIMTIIYQVLTVPYFIAFDANDTYLTLILDFVCTIVFLLDILVTMNTSFYKKGLLITTRRAIFQRYLQSWLIPDLVSSFPYSWVLQGPMTITSSNLRSPALLKVAKITRIIRTLRLLRVTRIRQYLSLLEQKLSRELSILFTLAYLCLLMIAIAHWAACGFYYMSQTPESVNNWVFAFQMENEGDVDKYVTALYWAVTTLTTTGYGDIVPRTTTERIYGIAIMIMSAGVFSYFIGKIGAVVATMDSDANDQKELVMDISRYLKASAVPDDITSRALRYLDYVWETRTRRKVLDKAIFNGFSEPLKNEISEHIFGKVLHRVPLMQYFDNAAISQLARGVSPQIYAQDDVIFECGQVSTDLYFLEKGSVEIYHKATQHTFKVLKVRNIQPGAHFGEIAFFADIPRTASARCVRFSELLSIARSAMVDLQRISPSAKYSLQEICDKIKARDFRDSGLKCYICKEQTHLAAECDRVTINIDKEAIKQKWLAKKRISSSKSIPQAESPGVKFLRRRRQVRLASRYCKHNVKCDSGWSRLPNSKYSLSKLFLRQQPEEPGDFAGVVSNGERDDMEYCQLTSTDRCHTEEPAETPSPPISPRRRYSILGGIRTYALFDEIRRVPMEGLTLTIVENHIEEEEKEVS